MGIRAARPAQRRSATGPFIFVLLIVGLLVGGFAVGRPIAEDAIVAQVQERPVQFEDQGHQPAVRRR